jgi:hypothetical protein
VVVSDGELKSLSLSFDVDYQVTSNFDCYFRLFISAGKTPESTLTTVMLATCAKV